ncbi:MAG: SPOR domain-containing protein [Candidatus Zixiibacteriota bacterium]
MWRRIVFSVVIVSMLSGTAGAQTVYSLIQKGKLMEARDSLSRLAQASVRDGNTLFYQGLLEQDGAIAVKSMEAAFEASLPSQHHEEISYRLAQYYLFTGDYRRLASLVSDYFSRWERGMYRAEMRRLSVFADERTGSYESALRQCDRYLVDNSSGDPQQWGLIDKARVLSAHGKQIGAAETIRQLSRSRKGVGVPLALYLLGMQAVTRNKADDAVFYYNMLREAYPAAIGLDQLSAGLGEMSDKPRTDNKAEKLTGTYYSVKVGVFSEADNAKRHADRFRGQGQKVDIETKEISGRNYRVVYVGTFDDYDEAVRFKHRLEAERNDTYQVVAR